jgi:hypothetical protein
MAIIRRRRGNTHKDLLTIISSSTNLPIDITGCSFVMNITTDKAPDSLGTNLLYSLTGAIVSPATNGQVTFTPTLDQATQADGTYYYEVIMTDTQGLTETVALDKYIYY